MWYDSCRPVVGSSICRSIAVLVALGLLAWAGEAPAQDGAVAGGPRFAPGVLTTIQPEIEPDETFSRHDIVELRADDQLQRKPNASSESRTLFEMAEQVRIDHDVWCLELSFKPLRMLYVDIPQPAGKMQRKLLWYMVYRIRNTGVGLTSEQRDDGSFTTVDKPVESLRFIPQFVLESQDVDRQGSSIGKAYLDRIIPSAYAPIARRELPRGGELLSSVEISERMLELESGRAIKGLWGVAMWEDVDPQIDFFSVYVGGLTNAYRWQDPAGAYQLGDPPGTGRKLFRKTLQLNFWRPGDEYAENEREVRFGVPLGKAGLYGVSEGVAYHWVYR